ncbi:sulfide/dihydroorotate dehydrogenase-like FAD/NAD-binding protein [Candidatus Omnitrophota bacterium]
MKILNKKILVDTKDTRVTEIDVQAPHIAPKALPGQFVILMVSEEGERIPLTVVDKNLSSGTIKLIFQELGFTTQLLGRLNAGDSLYALVGPLGHATQMKDYGSVIIIGGGVGIAEIFPVARGLKEAGNNVTTILGARTKEILILEDELKKVSDTLLICTDDGSYGKKGFTTNILGDLLIHKPQATSYKLVYAVGPIPMMERVAGITKEHGVSTLVSLNALMVDATGMCGCCRVKIGDEVKFSCVDGPEFDAHIVDWDELKKRTSKYQDKEAHICKLL